LSHSPRFRVVHVPGSVGGNAQGLSSHLRAVGLASEVWTLAPSPFGYWADRTVWSPGDGLLRREWKRLCAIWQAARDADVIHFNFGNTLAEAMPFRREMDRGMRRRVKTAVNAAYRRILLELELALYRLRGVVAFIHYQGDDARQGDVSRRFQYAIAHVVADGYYCRHSDRFKRRMIAKMARYCRQVYAVNPDLLHVLPPGARFIPYCHIALEDWMPVPVALDEARPLRIGHAPSHRGVKGTDRMLAAVATLKQEGAAFELDLIEGLTQAEARKRYEAIDIMVDQLHAGWYGGLAVEALALGKPVIVYLREDDLQFIPPPMRDDLPFIRATPDDITEVLRKVLSMSRQELADLAKRGRDFVERWHDPIKIATEVKSDYQAALAHRRSR
jgi:glycosyltransferase involved in cell wall biosynthesis